MKLRMAPQRTLRHQAGFAMMSGIFITTILFLLAAYLIQFRVAQDQSFAQDVRGTLAYSAARSGLEWGLYNSLRNDTCATSTAVTFQAATSIGGYTATVTCTRSSFDEAGNAIHVDRIVSNACNQPSSGNCPNNTPGANYAERQVTVTVAQ
jgi:MSHA biogenesis protein MshP